ncbi:hypothetical protein SNEBB_000932 [Seison nebaliae]|nr:hypothetical protein SNEBB_000932 [Seison nebaliae]
MFEMQQRMRHSQQETASYVEGLESLEEDMKKLNMKYSVPKHSATKQEPIRNMIITDEKMEDDKETLQKQADFEKMNGNIHFKNKDYNKAIVCYTNAIQLIDDNAIFYCNRGICLFRSNAFNAALRDFCKALELNKNYWKAYYHRANTFRQLNQLSNALVDCEMALKNEEKNKDFKKLKDELMQLIESNEKLSKRLSQTSHRILKKNPNRSCQLSFPEQPLPSTDDTLTKVKITVVENEIIKTVKKKERKNFEKAPTVRHEPESFAEFRMQWSNLEDETLTDYLRSIKMKKLKKILKESMLDANELEMILKSMIEDKNRFDDYVKAVQKIPRIHILSSIIDEKLVEVFQL